MCVLFNSCCHFESNINSMKRERESTQKPFFSHVPAKLQSREKMKKKIKQKRGSPMPTKTHKLDQ